MNLNIAFYKNKKKLYSICFFWGGGGFPVGPDVTQSLKGR